VTARSTTAGAVALYAALVACATPSTAGTAPAPSGGAALMPPPGFTAPVQNKRGGDDDAEECAAAPKPYTGKLEFPSKYEGSDKARDDLNPEAEAQYEAMTGDVKELERKVSSMVSHYLHSGRPELLDCTLAWLDAWAQAGALLAPTDNHTGRSVRKWALASVASAYVRLKFSSSQPLRNEAQRTQRIEGWLAKLGDMVVKDWQNQPLDKMNNHEYWAAWATMAAGVALNRRDFYDWALSQYRIGAKQVDGEGYLPNELKRDTRALSYHNYALGPLTMIAAFAKANGTEVAEAREPMQRLADRVLAGVDNPKTFEKKTGEKQTREGIHEPSKFAWMEPYCWTFTCGGDMKKRMDKMRPLKTYRLGGNLTELFAAPTKTAAKKTS
jgi:poly(beta-D-mannuronate) lyase